MLIANRKSPSGTCVTPSFRKSVPLVISVMWKLVIAPPSTGLGVIFSPLVVCVFTVVVALVTEGVSATALTVMVDVTTLPPKPAAALLVEAWTWKLAVPKKFDVGVNLRPAVPCVMVMKSPLLIGVVPSLWNNVPLLIAVIWKFVTSAPSAVLRPITRPAVVCVSSLVVALVTEGVSATALTVIVNVWTALVLM